MQSPWNRSFNGSWQDLRIANIEAQDRADMIKATKWAIAVVIFAALVGAIVFAFVDGFDKQALLDQQYPPPVRYVEQTYDRPAAYHKAYPTMQQMDSLHALQTVQEVMK